MRHSYFETIDTSDKAYLLGWLASDGWVYAPKNRIGIELIDENIVRVIKTKLESKNKIRSRKRKETHNRTFSLQMTSRKMVSDLGKFGIIQNKTKLGTPNMKNIPYKLRKDFIRGYFEGDGSLDTYETDKGFSPKLVITSFHKTMLLEIKKYIYDNTHVLTKISRRNIDRQVYDLVIGGVKRVSIVLNFLFSDEDCKVQRKYDKIRYIIDKYDKKYSNSYICVFKHRRKWVAKIKDKGSYIFYKSFDTEKEAARGYDSFVIDKGLDSKLLNFPYDWSVS